jgi:hypothetical protein
LAAIALAKPSQGNFRFNWTKVESVDGKSRSWHSDEEVFRIVEDDEKPENGFRLIMRVLSNKKCAMGPFHSLESAKEAANRIWNYMLQSNIHHSQVTSGGFMGVVSRVLFPHL